jgi:hypothetical protein
MAEPEVIYKTKLPAEKLPYYRLTIYMDELFEDPDLMGWYQWMVSKKKSCCIAMGVNPMSYGKLAVWVWGVEHGEEPLNAEQMGRVVMSHEWPEDIGQYNNRLR